MLSIFRFKSQFEKRFDRDIKTVKPKTPAELHQYLQSRSWEFIGGFKHSHDKIYVWDHHAADFKVFGVWSDIGKLTVEKIRRSSS